MSEELLCRPTCCFAFCYFAFCLLICVIINEIWLLPVAYLLSCSSFTCKSEMTNDSTLIASLAKRRALMLTRTWMAPRHQKHSGVSGAEVWFSRVDLFVTFTCSFWVLQAVLINWFAEVFASKLFAISTTSRNLTLVCAAPRYLWPLPISFTRRVSDVKPAINWVSHKLVSEIFIFALWSLISYTGFLRTDRFVFILQQAKKLLSFTGDPDACAIIFS